ncbi:MAG: hypothetical protein AB7N65_24465 [Vicinamibacterales bacterium]
MPDRRTLVTVTVACCLIAARPMARTIGVGSAFELQRALDEARGGDTIVLQRGTEYVGNFVLRGRSAADTGVITVRTESDWGLPREGRRMNPAYAPRLARLRSPNGQPVVRTEPGAHHWRLLLLEFPANAGGLGDIVALGDGSRWQRRLDEVPHHLAVERVYIHGDPTLGQKRGIALNAANVAIRDSWVGDIKAVGQDSQAIAGWNGPGGYLIENNWLEAAGENVLFGGADPSIPGLVPSDIVIRGNTLTKPTAWRERGPRRWSVKNLLELKNARRVLIEENLLARAWQDGQTGYGVLLTVRNQDGGCPWCTVASVRFERNRVRDTGGGVQVIGADPEYPTQPMQEISIRDNVFEGIDRNAWGGDGYFLLLGGRPSGVAIDHNTIVSGASGGLIKIANGPSVDFSFTNNIATHGDFGIIGTNRGVGDDSIRTYLPGARIEGNVIVGGNAARYPPGNIFPRPEVLMRHFQGEREGNYRLVPASPWRRAGTDGRDIGADHRGVPSAQGF